MELEFSRKSRRKSLNYRTCDLFCLQNSNMNEFTSNVNYETLEGSGSDESIRHVKRINNMGNQPLVEKLEVNELNESKFSIDAQVKHISGS